MTDTPKFQPWKTYEAEPEQLPIDAPPCVNCAYWRPERICAQLPHEIIQNAHRTRDELIEARDYVQEALKPKLPKGPASSQIYNGVRLCHSPEMNHDFSCFRELFT